MPRTRSTSVAGRFLVFSNTVQVCEIDWLGARRCRRFCPSARYFRPNGSAASFVRLDTLNYSKLTSARIKMSVHISLVMRKSSAGKRACVEKHVWNSCHSEISGCALSRCGA
jgi:hypothetical protein